MTTLIYIPGIFLGCFLILLILAKNGKKAYDFVLALWLLIITIHILGFYLAENQVQLFPKFEYVNFGIPLLQGPFLYVYTYLIIQNSKFTGRLLFHIIPFLIGSLGLLIFHDLIVNVISLLIVASGSIYIGYTFKMINGFKKTVTKHSWLRILILGLSLLWIVFIIIGALAHLVNYTIPHEYIFLSINIFVFAIGFFGLKDGHIMQEPKRKARYVTSSLSDHKLNSIAKKLSALMLQDRPFLNPDLSIHELATRLEIPDHYLSEVFSKKFDSNYHDYINKLRLNEFKSRLSDNELSKKTLIGIAFDSGFNSKSTFNRVFKKYNNQTPTEYLKSTKIVSTD